MHSNNVCIRELNYLAKVRKRREEMAGFMDGNEERVLGRGGVAGGRDGVVRKRRTNRGG